MDTMISEKLMELRNPFFNFIFKMLGVLGDNMLIWFIIALGFLLYHKNKQFITCFIGGGASVYVINTIIKKIVHRDRPFIANNNIIPLVSESSYSFPSGHSSSAFFAATILTFYFPKYRVWFFILAFLIAFSRIYVGVHYFSDVAFGAVEGVLIGWGVYWLVSKKLKLFTK